MTERSPSPSTSTSAVRAESAASAYLPHQGGDQPLRFWLVQYFARGEHVPGLTIAAGFTNRYMARRYAEEVAAGAGAPRGPLPWTDGSDGAQYLVTRRGTYVVGRDYEREATLPD